MSGTNELFAYQLFRNIFEKSKVIDGRFAVVWGIGTDVNTTNFGELVKDAIGGLVEQKKYPCVLLKPPVETGRVNDKGWTNMRFDMFFLTMAKRTGDGSLKTANLRTNISEHTKEQDWKDMREVAGAFRRKLQDLTRVPPMPTYFRENPASINVYTRLTYKGNDNLNGIWLQFEMQIAEDICENADYAVDVEIELPDFNTHPLHKH